MLRHRFVAGAVFFAALTGTAALGSVLATREAIRSREQEDTAFYGASSLSLAGLVPFLAYEAAALWWEWKPITQRTRQTWHEHPWWMAPGIFAVGALCAHLWWGPPDRRLDDQSP